MLEVGPVDCVVPLYCDAPLTRSGRKIPRIQLAADAHNDGGDVPYLDYDNEFSALYIIIFHEIHRYHEQIVVYDFVVNMLQYVLGVAKLSVSTLREPRLGNEYEYPEVIVES